MIYKDKVLPILGDVRELLLSQWGTAAIVNQKTDSATDIVTQVDYLVEEKVKQQLYNIFPDIEFVGEEFGGNRNAKQFWLMDPLDGTSHYMRGLPFCSSMIALIEDGVVVFSVIYDFLQNNFYWAQKGEGAFVNSSRLRVSNRSLKDSYISFETNLDVGNNQEIYTKIYDQSYIMKTFCSGWDFAMVASGKLDARVCLDPYGKDYDFAPGSLLVSEAGGVVTNIGSDAYDFSNPNFIMGNKTIYDELSKLIILQ